MTTQALQQIIALENELEAAEQAEQDKTALWLKEREAEICAAHAERLAALAQRQEEVRNQALREAEKKAAERVRSSVEWADRLAVLPDEALRRCLQEHLVAIITGRMP